MSIYVEILVRAPMDALWAHTQTPALHQQWDLRFSRIDYLQRAHETEPQRFRYTTRIGFGLEVSGEGETVGQRDLTDGSRSSALRFASGEPVSIIREGSGYWKYIPTTEGIRFVTWYDYRTRFGSVGTLFDRLIFRPLLGWATAWSFDRLRLWLEERVDPAQAMRQTLVHVIVPQAVRITIPPLTNRTIAITKGTALGSVVALSEILGAAHSASSLAGNPTPLTLGAIAYLVLFIPFVIFGRWVETRFAWRR